MLKTWVVIRREFVTRVRTKWFVVATVVGPLLMAAFILLPMLMATSVGGQRSITVLDATGTGFGAHVTQVLNYPTIPVNATRVGFAIRISKLLPSPLRGL